jgi:quinol monooxygenase YgiN
MTEPLIVVTKLRIKQGRLEGLIEYYKKIAEIVETAEPQLIAFLAFLNDDGTEMTSIQVHPDAASMDFHMQVLRDTYDESFSEYGQMFDVLSVEYYGSPPRSALDMDRQFEMPVSLNPRHIAGFTRGLGRAAG